MPRRVPASMPGRIWESSAGPGRCVRAFSGGRERAARGKGTKRELFFFILYANPGFNSPQHIHVYRPRNRGHGICHKNSRGDKIFSSSALSPSPPLSVPARCDVRLDRAPSSSSGRMAATDTGQTRVVPLQNVAYDISQRINYLLNLHQKTEPKKPHGLRSLG